MNHSAECQETRSTFYSNSLSIRCGMASCILRYESWTLKAAEKKRLKLTTFEMTPYWRMMRISWTEHIRTNQ